MKVLKKLTDWKTWVFSIIPFLLIFTGYGILIYLGVKEINNIPVIITSLLLCDLGILMLNCPVIVQHLRRKLLLRGLAAIVFTVCFVALQAVFMTKIPEIIKLDTEKQLLYEEYKNTSYDDKDHSKKRDNWFAVSDKLNDLSLKTQLLCSGSYLAEFFAICCLKKSKELKTEDGEAEKENKKDT